MQEKILDFIHLVQQAGVPVTLWETLDSLKSLSIVGMQREDDVRAVLRSTLVKKSGFLPIFDELFDIFFLRIEKEYGQKSKELLDDLFSHFPFSQEEIAETFQNMLQNLLDMPDEEMKKRMKTLLQSHDDEMTNLLALAAKSVGIAEVLTEFQEKLSIRRMFMWLGMDELKKKMDALREKVLDSEMTEDEKNAFLQWMDNKLKLLHDTIEAYVKRERRKNEIKRRNLNPPQELLDRPLFTLDAFERQELRHAIAALSERLKALVAVKMKEKKDGKLHVRKTLRKNFSHDSVMFKLHFERKRINKPKLIIICDVSDSVRYASVFMLQFVYSIQELYSRVRSFIFVNELGDVTRVFKEKSLEGAIDHILSGDVIDTYCHTDYGEVLVGFHRDYLHLLDKRTTVLILGDARTNYTKPQEWVLRDIKEKSRKVIWLNPEPRHTWGLGDSVTHVYIPYCNVFEEVRTTRQIYEAARKLVG